MSKGTAKDHARTIWCMRLRSALRTALACAIVGGATLQGPTLLIDQIRFVALSYVTVILILSNHATTLGHALSGCWHALHATIQVVPPAMLARYLVAPGYGGGMPAVLAAGLAAGASFVVAMPESTHVTAKRIALAQVALICTEVVVSSDDTRYGFMNPIHVGASSVLGAFASLLALLLPIPGLAHHNVNKLCHLYAENASERMDLYLKASNAGQDGHTKMELLLQAKPIAEIGTKLLQTIKILQEGMRWERPWSRCSKGGVESRLQSYEIPIRAIEYSLTNNSSFSSPVFQIIDQEQYSSVSQHLSSQLENKIKKIIKRSKSDHVENISDDDDDLVISSSLVPTEQNYETACFMLSCIDMLLDEKRQITRPPNPKTKSNTTQKLKSWILKLTSRERLIPAIKYSVSLALSLLLGVIIEKENAVWAGLTVAIGFTTARQPILTTTNAKAQGTAVGSVYGVICCSLFRTQEIRLVAIIPWIVFAMFLKHSRMYGKAGGPAAAIAALLILGRKDYGPTAEFAIGRLVSVFIGLFCLFSVEVALQPARAATLAKSHLCETLALLQELLEETGSGFFCREKNEGLFEKFYEKQRVLKGLVADAESEPDFWHLPFQRCCYKKVVGCLYNVVSVLYVVMYNLEMVSELRSVDYKEFEERFNCEMEELQGSVSSSLEKISLIKKCEEDIDIEEGAVKLMFDPEELISSLILSENDDNKQLRERVGAIGFCINSLRKEINQIEICINEIAR